VEFVFVDDCSQDGSIDILYALLEEFPERKDDVKIIRHKDNRGVACARNTGLDNATGDYVMFVDADDWLEPGAMSQIYEVASNGNYDIVGYDWLLEYERNRRYSAQPVYDDTNACFKSMLSGGLRWYLWAFMVRRSLYVDNNFRFIPGVNVGEDMMILLKLFSVARSYFHISNALYHYIRLNKSSVTQLESQKQFEIVKYNVEEVIQYVNNKFGSQYAQELQFFKLNVKFPLLISDVKSNYELWNDSFSEANSSIWENEFMSFRSKLLQWMAFRKQYWFLILYYRIIFKFVYGVLYK
jgi:glycosyltransferase involved in cell wall biosynthesis